MKALAITAIVVGTVALAAVAIVAVWASMADAPWEDTSTEQAAETPPPKPTVPKASFTSHDAQSLTQAQVSEQGLFPGETEWVGCDSASYRSGNRVWVVTCKFFLNRDDLVPDQEKTYTFDDRTGKIR